MIFHNFIARAAKRDPGRAAVIVDGKATSYIELLNGVRREIQLLEKSRPPLVVARYTDPVHFIERTSAALSLGISVFPSLRPLPVETYRAVLEYTDRLIGDPARMYHYTSGSYGTQKIVVRPIANLFAEAESVSFTLQMDQYKTVLATMPLSYSYGCGLWRAVVFSGATLCISAKTDILDRVRSWKRDVRRGVDYIFGVPFVFRLMTRQGDLEVYGKPGCFSGGEPLPRDTAERWYAGTGLPLVQEYGLSEGGIATLGVPGESPYNSIGWPISGVKVLADKIGPGAIGELVVYREHPPTRYLKGESPETFGPHGGIRTGDLGYRSAKGIMLTGRLKSVIAVAGMKMVPYELEEALRQHPEVRDAAVLGVPDDSTGQRPEAFVTARGGSIDLNDVLRSIKGRLASYKVPKHLNVLSELPRTTSGKVDRDALRKTL